MGVAGSGKTTIGRQLAAELGWDYFEADEFHPPANIAKMSQGKPLDDADRMPWLAAIRAQIDRQIAAGRPGIFTCSALKAAYRRILAVNVSSLVLVYLRGRPETIMTRVAQRQGHYMKADMVRSQFADLEEPTGALTLDIEAPPEELVARIRAALAPRSSNRARSG